MDLSTTGAEGLIGAVVGLGGAGLGILSERLKGEQQRKTNREESFEEAQTGYRACYQKFLDTAAACINKRRDGKTYRSDLRELYRNFDEACLTGDPLVAEALLAYWPTERRNNQEPPEEMPPADLIKTMCEHGYRSLDAQDKLKKSRSD